MAGTGTPTRKFKQECLNRAIEAGDVVKLAFYASSATVDDTTAAYTATGEVTNSPNIPAGGITLSGMTGGDGTLATAHKDWSDVAPVVVGTFTARKALIYNSTKGYTISFHDFGADKTAVDEPFPVTIPASGTGLIRL